MEQLGKENKAYLNNGVSEKEIKSRIYDPNIKTRLIITPLIDIDSRIQKNTVTLSLGTKYLVMKETRYSAINPLDVTKDRVEEILEKVVLEYSETIVLRPGQMVLAGTFEYISLPYDMSAQVGSRSTYGRLALVPATATFVHPGFKGCLTLELVNVGADPIILCPRMEVAQLIFSYYGGEANKLVTRYKLPTGPEFPKVWEDKNLEKLRKFKQIVAK
jgi:deoxycytidine triphosphate deaminase